MSRLDLFPNDELISSYRQMMSGSKSEDALLHIIYDLGIFEETHTDEDVALRNYGIRLIKILGGGEVQQETIREFIKRLSKQPLQNKQED